MRALGNAEAGTTVTGRRIGGPWTLVATIVLVAGVLGLATLQPSWLDRAVRAPFRSNGESSRVATNVQRPATAGGSNPVIVVSPPRTPAGEVRRVGPEQAAPPVASSTPQQQVAPLGLGDPPANRPATGAVAERICEVGPGGQGSCLDPCEALESGARVPNSGSLACVQDWLANIDAARASEGVGPMVLPSNFFQLTPPEQLLVVVDLERTARGLPPMVGLTTTLDQVAGDGVALGQDPSLPGVDGWRSIWAGGHASVLGTLYGWMYDDGWGGPDGTTNVGCSSPTASGCWGHRRAILDRYGGCRHCLMGAAWSEDGAGWQPGAWAAVFVPRSDDPGAGPLAFSWASELPDLPACERDGDTC